MRNKSRNHKEKLGKEKRRDPHSGSILTMLFWSQKPSCTPWYQWLFPKCELSLRCQHVEAKLNTLGRDRTILVLEALKYEGAVPEEEKTVIVQSCLCIHLPDGNL